MAGPLLLWFAALDLLGWVHAPLTFRIGRHLRDRGLALSKVAGLFVTAYAGWLLGCLKMPHGQGLLLAVVGLLAVANAWLAWRDRAAWRSFLRRRWAYVLALEALLWGGGIGAALVRAHVPAIAFDPNWWGAEKWSDFALLTSLARQPFFPPIDPWFAGLPVNYYYFGHLAWATMTKLTGLAPNVTYNLAVASVVALALAACLGLGYHLFRSLGLGLLLAFLVVLGGNFKPLLELYQNWRDYGQAFAGYDFFWVTSRAMAWGPEGLIRGGEINEIPSFSFILGDLHPHYSAHPVTLGFLLILAGIWRAGQRRTFAAGEVLRNNLAQWLAMAFVVGLLYATNSWDAGVALVLAAGTLPFARTFRAWPWSARATLVACLLILLYIVAVRVFFLPFERYFVPPQSFGVSVRSWLPPFFTYRSPIRLAPAELRSTVTQWLFYFGLFALPYIGWQIASAARHAPRIALERLTALLAVALAAGIASTVEAQNRLVGLLTFLLVALAPAAFRARRRFNLEFVAILTWLAILVSLATEWLYYDDIFAGENERINTIFKVYYALWPSMALGAVGACSALWGGPRSAHRRARRVAAGALMLLLAAIGSLYPLFAWTSRIATYGPLETGSLAPPLWRAQIPGDDEAAPAPALSPVPSRMTLDGLAYLARRPGLADDYRAALWLRENVPPYATIAEAADWGYSFAGRFATIGGVPSVLGWWQHETAWREGFDARLIDERRLALDTLYTTLSLVAVLRVLVQYDIDYVAVGTLERRQYPAEGLAKFETIAQPVVRFGATTIYATKATAEAPAPATAPAAGGPPR